jgi:erythromycin esterase-like protein
VWEKNNTIKEKWITENFTKLDNSKDLDILLDRIDDSQIVLLGEASHGTSEFYRRRTEITKRLIKEKGFSFIALEGDWPDCYKVNRYIKGFPDSENNAYDVLYSFNRWPTWMWANKEMIELVEWLKLYNNKQKQQLQEENVINSSISNKKIVGFYGLDLYSLWESMEAIIQYLKKIDPTAIKNAIEAYNCFEPYGKDVENYARVTAFVPENCEDEVIEMLSSVRNKMNVYSKKDHGNRGEEEYFNAEQNAITAKNAELYYRTMIAGDIQSWNIRDNHMMETLERLIAFHDKEDHSKAKAIVWAHNTHIGDARATDMSKDNMINLGQLVRERKSSSSKNNTVLVGFGTYNGSVIAAKRWGDKMEEMKVPPAISESWDYILHNIKIDSTIASSYTNNNKLIIFSHDDEDINNKINENSNNKIDNGKWRDQRAIGVVYNPQYEKYRNYVLTNLSLRYDAFLFIDETHALNPLHMSTIDDKDLPETFPTGV